MMNASTLTELIAACGPLASEIFGGTPVFLAYAFGSRVHGRAHPGSDLDIGYYAGP